MLKFISFRLRFDQDMTGWIAFQPCTDWHKKSDAFDVIALYLSIDQDYFSKAGCVAV
jgi:hypothetical protein